MPKSSLRNQKPGRGWSRGGRRQQQRKNRPGFNSYLKIELDESTLTFLHNTTSKLQQDLAQQLSNNNNEEQNSGSDRIRPRSLKSLHLTYFFGGEVLCNLTGEELSTWHSSVKTLLAQHGFHPEHVPSAVSSTEPPLPHAFAENYWLRIKEFRLFPPGRNYLIVAELEASPALHDMYRELREIAKTSPCKALNAITEASKDVWIPHVTLANIQGKGAEASQLLTTLLEQLQAELLIGSAPRVLPGSIGMGGPVPTATALDWDFYPRQILKPAPDFQSNEAGS